MNRFHCQTDIETIIQINAAMNIINLIFLHLYLIVSKLSGIQKVTST